MATATENSLSRAARRQFNMLACLITAKGHAELKEVPKPRLQPGEILVKLAAAGICGTDLEKLQGGYGQGGILGHEVSGTIAEVGRGIENLQEADRVLAHHHVPCYNCYYCERGHYTMCDLFKATNFDPCGLADYFRVPRANVDRGAVVELPQKVTFEEGAMIEPAACCVRALRKAHVNSGDRVLVIGLGPTGLTQIQILKHMGARPVIGSDIVPCRIEMARKLGANVTFDSSSGNVAELVRGVSDGGVDLAVVSTGNPKAIQPAIDSVRKGGRVLLFGAPAIGSTLNLDVSVLFHRQISIITSYSCVDSDIHQTLDLLDRGQIDLKCLITDRFALRDAPEALEHARASGTSIKTVITTI